MELFGTWLAAFFTLGIISFLYKDNPWYKLSEAVFVGISAGYWFVVSYWDNLYGKLYVGVSVNHDYMLLVGAILGFMMILRLIPSIGWISRWPLAFIVGAIAGLYLMNYFSSNVMAQVQSSILPFFSTHYGASIFSASFGTIVANLVVVVGTFTGLVYFYFSKEHVGAFGGAAKIGIWVIMITFGASFGYTVMSRMSLLIGRMDFIFGDWLGMIQ
ncbi:MAG: hypothetical protein CVT49_10665 [candidate division Zixibacteria bacterium HGW-Zixibacteria-1]|nr:MAG: hypothetical protein CVT49_10665 [candidate division Zixibacteria bacterium HGW-Zixibacteria-1]